MEIDTYKLDEQFRNHLEIIALGQEPDITGIVWVFNGSTVYMEEDNKFTVIDTTKDTPQMTHTLSRNNYVVSNLYDEFVEIFNQTQIETLNIIKSKLNLNFPSNSSNKKRTHQNIHVDVDRKLNKADNFYKSMVCYLNDTDGDTLFFDDNMKVCHTEKAEKGKVVVFDSTIYHAGQNPIESNVRLVYNSVFIPLSIYQELQEKREKL